MELFEKIFPPLLSFIDGLPQRRTWNADTEKAWPPGGSRNIVLKENTGLELGSPEKESVSCLLWTGDSAMVTDSRISLIGPDFPESFGKSLPFGKVVILAVEGFDEDNAYDRHRELDFVRYDLDLRGFMMRAVSQYMREWCRISREALHEGFSTQVLGSSLLNLFKARPFVKKAEVVFVTSSTKDVARIKEITSPAEKIIAAMNKMASELSFDCDTCEYQEVCNEADDLRSMRRHLIGGAEKQTSSNG